MKSLLFAVAFVFAIVAVSSAGVARPAVAAPTMMPWGMVGTAVAMGLSGLYFIFKRKK